MLLNDDEILVSMWKEVRTTINHLDKMMDGVRGRVFTLFGTISSIAAALYYWAPNTFLPIPFLGNFRLAVIVELAAILVIIPSFIQNRVYHFWLYRTMRTTTILENMIYNKLEKNLYNKEVMITYSLTRLESPPEGYWRTMWHSILFKMDITVFLIIFGASIILSLIFA